MPYMRLGVSSGAALLLLLGSLIGSYINIPVVQLPEQHILSGRPRRIFWRALFCPCRDRLARHRDRDQCRRRAHPDGDVALSPRQKPGMGLGLLAIACVARVSHWLAQPVPGVGIAVPTFAPALTAAISRVGALAPLAAAARIYSAAVWAR